MAYYRHTYMPGFTTNDTYGNFYDAKKASLITVPDRLKNYDLDVKNTRTETSGAQYGEFMSQQQPQPQSRQQQPQWPLKPYSGAYSQQEPLEGLDRHIRPPPPPPMPSGYGAPLPPPPLSDPEPLASSREPPPPVSIDRYRNPTTGGRGPEENEAATARRLPRSRSPPPPPDLGSYRTNIEAYTGRGQAVPMPSWPSRRLPSPQQSPPSSPGPSLQMPPPPPPALTQRTVPPPHPNAISGYGDDLLPALKYGAKEIHLPDIEAVELHMRDKSKVILNVREFYNRYLRE